MSWNSSLVDGPIEIEGSIGYHLNVAREAFPQTLEHFEVSPEPRTPVRVFMGDEQRADGRYQLTAFLQFDSEEEAIANLPDLWLEDPEELEE